MISETRERGTVIFEAEALENRKLLEDRIGWRLDVIPDSQMPEVLHGNSQKYLAKMSRRQGVTPAAPGFLPTCSKCH